ncbi:hypothetical protein ARAM_005294 [Aspergillus rambellii]|uniref:C2H2-type domain-containing protein n=1 Tax=Aspergillus rambellii TaxID=308745 RepID=A0A0F8XB64_9EURO|nr:hypothetical protein ARAM_005294 [Aspergillus rambellii]
MAAEKRSRKNSNPTFRPKRHHCTVPSCGKAFTRLSHLQRHSLNHSETQWVCSRCNAPFKRLDLLERHKARHSVKDRLAGGTGLGILQTRRKTFHGATPVPDAPISPESPGAVEDTLPVSRKGAYQTSTNHLLQQHQAAVNENAAPDVGRPGLPVDLGASSNSSEIAVPMLDVSEMAAVMSPSANFAEFGNMYYDTTFDSVHFDVMGINRLSPELSPVNSAGSQSVDGVDSYENDTQETQPSLPLRCSPRGLNWAEIQPYRIAPTIEDSDIQLSARGKRSVNFIPQLNASTVLPLSSNEMRRRLEAPIHDVVQETIEGEPTGSSQPQNHPSSEPSELQLSSTKRDEILDLLSEIRPVFPDGSLVGEKAPELSLQNMQEFLDLFLRYFNTSYPMVHVATLEASSAEPIFLLSMIVLGATYKNKVSHQLSVCLYDAIVPYILSGLMSIPLPDLSTLQAFLILECYGMYRAGPYQRENAMLIHTLLFSAIRRVSRYHVRGRVMLPHHLFNPHRRWRTFSLILFFFMWDTQNVSCYSFMPSMSTQTIQVQLPCSKELWEARTEEEWSKLSQARKEPPNFNDTVKQLVEDGDNLQCEPLDGLSLTLVLHGLMSMCNDMVHFDNRSIYLGDLEKGEVSWTPWRRQMTHALETWKAKYDAYSMASVQTMAATVAAGGDEERTQASYQKESIALLALYHTAHIVINCKIRHLQAAAGAKAIFGHIVNPPDREESMRWVRLWITEHSSAADHAAWHAAQMFREGLLYLKNWDVNGLFHYPWCLVIGTLTCWSFHRFGGEGLEPSACNHPPGRDIPQGQSQALMNHLVSLMASVAPTNVRRTLTKCCTHGLSIEVARYLKSVRWTAAYEAMKLLEGLSGTT